MTTQLFPLHNIAPAPYNVGGEKVTAPAPPAFRYMFRRVGTPARHDESGAVYYTLRTSLDGLRLELKIGARYCEFGVSADRDLERWYNRTGEIKELESRFYRVTDIEGTDIETDIQEFRECAHQATLDALKDILRPVTIDGVEVGLFGERNYQGEPAKAFTPGDKKNDRAAVKPCPRCEGTELRDQRFGEGWGRIECLDCGYVGEAIEIKNQDEWHAGTVAAWNEARDTSKKWRDRTGQPSEIQKGQRVVF